MDKHGETIHAFGEPWPDENLERSECARRGSAAEHRAEKVTPQAPEISHNPQSAVDVDGDGCLEAFRCFVTRSTYHRGTNFDAAKGKAAEQFSPRVITLGTGRK